MSAVELQPPLRWVGGKRWLVPRLRELYALHRDRRLVESFVGGGAVMLGLQPKCARLTDVNAHLIVFYNRLRDSRPFTIRMENTAEVYYAHRERFNDLIGSDEGRFSFEAAELFYYLNRTCFNGVCRFNRSGKFNVPYGKKKSVEYRRDFSEYAEMLWSWDFGIGSFERCLPSKGDFWFLDPPYDVEFTTYSQGGFTWEQQVQLATLAADHSGPVVACNQATDRILDLYRGLKFSIETLDAPRRVSCNGDRRPALELLATKNI